MSRLRYARLQRRADQDETPADGAAAARAPGSARRDRAPDGPHAELLELQQSAGNKAVAGLVASVQTLPFGIGSSLGKGKQKTGSPTPAKVAPGQLPKAPAIAASASGIAQGGSFGGHASVYLAVPFGGQLEYMFIDLIMERSGNKKGAIDIRIMPLKGSWPGPETSTTWNVGGDNAQRAWRRALSFQLGKQKYTYNYFGIGYRAYNCALFAQKILEAAGIKQSAGLVVSTPLEVALGRKLPKMRKREKKSKGPAPIPAQYEI